MSKVVVLALLLILRELAKKVTDKSRCIAVTFEHTKLHFMWFFFN